MSTQLQATVSQLKACQDKIDSITATGLHPSLAPRFKTLLAQLEELKNENTQKRTREEESVTEIYDETPVMKKAQLDCFDHEGFFRFNSPEFVGYFLKQINVAQKFEAYLSTVYNNKKLQEHDHRSKDHGVLYASALNVFYNFHPIVKLETPSGIVTGKWRFFNSLLLYQFTPLMKKAREEFYKVWTSVVDRQIADMDGNFCRVEIYNMNYIQKLDTVFKFTKIQQD